VFLIAGHEESPSRKRRRALRNEKEKKENGNHLRKKAVSQAEESDEGSPKLKFG